MMMFNITDAAPKFPHQKRHLHFLSDDEHKQKLEWVNPCRGKYETTTLPVDQTNEINQTSGRERKKIVSIHPYVCNYIPMNVYAFPEYYCATYIPTKCIISDNYFFLNFFFSFIYLQLGTLQTELKNYVVRLNGLSNAIDTHDISTWFKHNKTFEFLPRINVSIAGVSNNLFIYFFKIILMNDSKGAI